MAIFHSYFDKIMPEKLKEKDEPYKSLFNLDHDFITNGLLLINNNGKD
jgi:hypothetical protein